MIKKYLISFVCLALFHLHSLFGCEVLTIGDLIIDSILFVNEEYLQKIGGIKGGSQLINYEQFYQILSDAKTTVKYSCGGSSFNTMKVLSKFGHTCCFIGAIGQDEFGQFCKQKLDDHGIDSVFHYSYLPTARCVSLVTPDGERTMRTFLGASTTLKSIELPKQCFSDIRLFHIEGYQLQNRDLILKAISFAKDSHAILSLDLSSPEVISRNHDLLYHILTEKKIDILFCNEAEAERLTLLPAEEACELLSSYCKMVVVTQAEKGCWVKTPLIKQHFSSFETKVVDPTGAGDFFSAGFLHGFLLGEPIEKCVYYGRLLATQIIQQQGTDLSEEEWEDLLSKE